MMINLYRRGLMAGCLNDVTRRGLLAVACGMSSGIVRAQQPQPVRLPRRVRVAVLGLEGHVGEILDSLKSLPDVGLVAISDRDPNLRRKIRQRPGLESALEFADHRELLEKCKLDVAGICGGNGERADLILACAQRKLHVVAEKPLAIERDQLERVKEAVLHNGIRITMLLPMRFWPAFQTIQQVVRSGKIGEVAQVAAQKSYKLEARPDWMKKQATFGGIFPYIGIHMLDLLRFATGLEVVEVASLQSRVGHSELQEMEDTSVSIFGLANGANASIRLDYLRPDNAATHGDDRFRIAGTRGIVEYREGSGVTLLTADHEQQTLQAASSTPGLFVDFLESVYAGKPAGLTAQDCYIANQVVLSTREAAKAHRLIRL